MTTFPPLCWLAFCRPQLCMDLVHAVSIASSSYTSTFLHLGNLVYMKLLTTSLIPAIPSSTKHPEPLGESMIYKLHVGLNALQPFLLCADSLMVFVLTAVYSEKKLIHSSVLESTIILKSCLESIQISPDGAILIPIELWKWSGIKRRGNEKKTKERAAGTTENTGGFSVSKPCMEENNTIGLSLLRIDHLFNYMRVWKAF